MSLSKPPALFPRPLTFHLVLKFQVFTRRPCTGITQRRSKRCRPPLVFTRLHRPTTPSCPRARAPTTPLYRRSRLRTRTTVRFPRERTPLIDFPRLFHSYRLLALRGIDRHLRDCFFFRMYNCPVYFCLSERSSYNLIRKFYKSSFVELRERSLSHRVTEICVNSLTRMIFVTLSTRVTSITVGTLERPYRPACGQTNYPSITFTVNLPTTLRQYPSGFIIYEIVHNY